MSDAPKFSEHRPQPEQLTHDSSRLRDALDRRFPVGQSGEWKRAGDLTREDIAAQVRMWKATVRGVDSDADPDSHPFVKEALDKLDEQGREGVLRLWRDGELTVEQLVKALENAPGEGPTDE